MIKYNFVELAGLEALAKDAICGVLWQFLLWMRH
jgi:hypothetical protein